MPITVNYSPAPALLGQAGLAIGQGQANQDALRNLAMLSSAGRYGGGRGGSGGGDNGVYHMGRMPDTGVERVSQAIADGDVGGTPGLQSPDEGIADSTLNPPQDQPPPPDYDNESQARMDTYQKARHDVLMSDNLYDADKQKALSSLDANWNKSVGARPLKPKQSMDEIMQQNSWRDPVTNSLLIRDPSTNKVTHVIPGASGGTGQQSESPRTAHETPGGEIDNFGELQDPSQVPPDATPIDPNDPATMQGMTADPSQPSASPTEQAFNNQTFTRADGSTWAATKWDKAGNPVSFKLLSGPPKEAKTPQGLSVHDLMQLETQARKMLATTDPTDPNGKRTIPASQDQVDQYVSGLLQRHGALKAGGRSTGTANNAQFGAQSRGAKPAADVQIRSQDEAQIVHEAVAQARAAGASKEQAKATAINALQHHRAQSDRFNSEFEEAR